MFASYIWQMNGSRNDFLSSWIQKFEIWCLQKKRIISDDWSLSNLLLAHGPSWPIIAPATNNTWKFHRCVPDRSTISHVSRLVSLEERLVVSENVWHAEQCWTDLWMGHKVYSSKITVYHHRSSRHWCSTCSRKRDFATPVSLKNRRKAGEVGSSGGARKQAGTAVPRRSLAWTPPEEAPCYIHVPWFRAQGGKHGNQPGSYATWKIWKISWGKSWLSSISGKIVMENSDSVTWESVVFISVRIWCSNHLENHGKDIGKSWKIYIINSVYGGWEGWETELKNLLLLEFPCLITGSKMGWYSRDMYSFVVGVG